jgi:hypothetical protein
MTDQELKDLVAGLAISNAQNEKLLAELMQAQKNTEKVVVETNRQLGGIGNSNGKVAEEIVHNTFADSMTLGNVKYVEIYRNLSYSKKGLHAEFDIIMVECGNSRIKVLC